MSSFSFTFNNERQEVEFLAWAETQDNDTFAQAIKNTDRQISALAVANAANSYIYGAPGLSEPVLVERLQGLSKKYAQQNPEKCDQVYKAIMRDYMLDESLLPRLAVFAVEVDENNRQSAQLNGAALQITSPLMYAIPGYAERSRAAKVEAKLVELRGVAQKQQYVRDIFQWVAPTRQPAAENVQLQQAQFTA